MQLSVSVVIDTYNYGQFIERAIESALGQDLPEHRREILVVDDGSTDDTPALVARFGSLVRYVRKSNGGQASAFNHGVRTAEGDVICFLDADDRYYPSRLSAVLAILEHDPAIGVVFNRYDVVDERGTVLASASPRKLYSGDISGRVLLGYVTGSPTTGISARRELLLRNPIPEDLFRMSADYFYLNLLPLQTRVGCVTQSLHAYLSHGLNAYLTRPSAVQQQMHEAQRGVIWEFAEQKFGKRFVRGVHSYGFLGAQASFGVRLAAFQRDVDVILWAPAPVALKVWTLSKIVGHLLLPGGIYNRMATMRDRVRV